MFGWKEQNERYKELINEMSHLRMALQDLTKANEEAIINRETITKFIDDLKSIVKIAKIEADKEKEFVKKPGRPKKGS